MIFTKFKNQYDTFRFHIPSSDETNFFVSSDESRVYRNTSFWFFSIVEITIKLFYFFFNIDFQQGSANSIRNLHNTCNFKLQSIIFKFILFFKDEVPKSFLFIIFAWCMSLSLSLLVQNLWKSTVLVDLVHNLLIV